MEAKCLEIIKESLDAVPKWLHEYIVAGKYKLTTESLSIGMDVAIYLGEVFVHEFPQIYWGFFTKPKSRVSVNEPVLLGFENGLDMNPRRIVDTLMWQCANGKSSEGLYEVFEIWSKFVPAQPSKTNQPIFNDNGVQTAIILNVKRRHWGQRRAIRESLRDEEEGVALPRPLLRKLFSMLL